MPDWPNLFVAGAQKAASTSLHGYLDQHPEIYMSPEKAPAYFSRLAEGETGPGDEEAYLALFEGAEGYRLRGETSPSYLYHPDVPDLIHEKVPDAKILVSVRDPIQRACSHYWRRVAGATEEAEFVDAVEREIVDRKRGDRGMGYLHNSEYAEPVRRYIDTFGRDQVHVALLADLKDDPVAYFEEIFAFLEVDTGPAETIDTTHQRNTFRGIPYGGVAEKVRTSTTLKGVAQAVLPKGARDWLGNQLLLDKTGKPPIPEEAKAVLADHFEPDVAELEELLDRDLSKLRRSWPD